MHPGGSRSSGSDANYDWISARDLGAYVVGLLRETLPGSHDTLHELQDLSHVQALLKKQSK